MRLADDINTMTLVILYDAINPFGTGHFRKLRKLLLYPKVLLSLIFITKCGIITAAPDEMSTPPPCETNLQNDGVPSLSTPLQVSLPHSASSLELENMVG
jgi:hypothetical protein